MYQLFRKTFFEHICFSNNQIKLNFPKFDNKNLVRWQEKGYIIKLRNGIYTFSEYLEKEEIDLYIANRIYRPSYISLHYVLNFYGIIPEVINSITSVSTIKTKQFNNVLGNFSYQTINSKMFFGYEVKKANNFDVLMATPEKALIDLFYLYPMYNTYEEIEYLRFDANILKNIINTKILDGYLNKINIKSINNKIEIMRKIYNI